MLTVYPRHLADCEAKLRSKGMSPREMRTWRRCGCPLWIIGTDPRGEYHRRTLNTANWSIAEEKRRAIEAGESDRPRVTIADATDAWLGALRAAKRKDRTVSQVHGAMTRSLVDWCASNGHVHLDRLTLSVLDQFVNSWDYASTTHRSRIDLMRSFFKFALARKWIAENPAAGLIKPEEDLEPTLPFTTDEEAALFAAAERFTERANLGGLWVQNHVAARALLLVMRWTGLRASDAVIFEPRAIESIILDGRAVSVYRTYQTKTGEHVLCPLPPEVAAVIQSAPRMSEPRAFIPPESAQWKTDARSVSNGFYSSYLCPLSTLSGVPEVRAHRFRDTFAVRLLEAGKPLEIVQMLLGHKSIKTTEKHYAPWVRSRQEMLIREVMGMWR